MEQMPVEGLMQAEAGVYGMIAATPDPAEGSWYLYAAVIPGLTGTQTEALRRWALISSSISEPPQTHAAADGPCTRPARGTNGPTSPD